MSIALLVYCSEALLKSLNGMSPETYLRPEIVSISCIGTSSCYRCRTVHGLEVSNSRSKQTAVLRYVHILFATYVLLTHLN
jgi:hypothetical protein